MTSLLLQFVFIALLVILPMALYRSRRSFMAVFYRAMTDNAQARKFYTQVLVVLLLLFHYVYTTGHPGQFGTVLKAFVACGVFALAVCIVPQLFTLSVTVSYILLAALFYPSGRVLAEWEDRDRRLYLSEHPDEMSDIYHCNHHARLP